MKRSIIALAAAALAVGALSVAPRNAEATLPNTGKIHLNVNYPLYFSITGTTNVNYPDWNGRPDASQSFIVGVTSNGNGDQPYDFTFTSPNASGNAFHLTNQSDEGVGFVYSFKQASDSSMYVPGVAGPSQTRLGRSRFIVYLGRAPEAGDYTDTLTVTVNPTIRN